MGPDALIIRWAVAEVRILKNNLFALARLIRGNFIGMPLHVFTTLSGGMETIVESLSVCYDRIFGLLLDHSMPDVWAHLDLFGEDQNEI